MLNEKQQYAFDILTSNDKGRYLLTAPAGYGKSFTLAKVIAEYIDTGKHIAITAPSHKACRQIESFVNEEGYNLDVKTIHAHLGFVLIDNGEASSLQPIRNFKYDKPDVLIIDEFSMLTRQLQRALESHNIDMIIYVGDKNQLVIDRFFNLNNVSVLELVEPVRQNQDSKLLSLLSDIKHSIEKKGNLTISNVESDDVKWYESHDEFMKSYKDNCTDKIILAYTNACIKHYNRNIIKHLMKKDSEYNKDDTLILRQPLMINGNKIYNNNDTVKIKDVIEYDKHYSIVTTDNIPFKVPKSITEFNNNLKELASIAKQKKNWKPYYQYKEQFLLVHHVFALTTHKAQGSTYDEVYIDLSDIKTSKKSNDLDDTYKRLLYVSMSRARHRVHLFYGDKRDYKKGLL